MCTPSIIFWREIKGIKKGVSSESENAGKEISCPRQRNKAFAVRCLLGAQKRKKGLDGVEKISQQHG